MKFQGFVGPAYTLDALNIAAQRCVNLFAEKIEGGAIGKEGSVAYLRNTPGLNLLFEVGTGPIRLIVIDDPKVNVLNPENRVYIVSGSEVYTASFADGDWTTEKIGDIETIEGPVYGMAIQGGPSDLAVLILVDRLNCYYYNRYLDDALLLGGFGTFGDQGWPTPEAGATQVLWIDGFFIYICAGKNQFYVSQWGQAMDVSPLSFASAEGDPDNLVGAIALNRNLWLFNERTIEVWANTGNADFPFERISGGFIEKGCLAEKSIAKIDQTVFWLGRDANGEGQIFSASGLAPQRVSTHAIERARL